MLSSQILLVVCLAVLKMVVCKDYLRVCYYTNWSGYRKTNGYYQLDKHYQTGLCTHIIYSFGKVASDASGGYTIMPYEEHDTQAKGGYYKLNKVLKSKDKNLKTLLAVGGWNHASIGFKDMVKTKRSRAYFIEESKKYLMKYGFDGLDLDWEYPAQRGSPLGDKKLFADLCEELRAAYRPYKLLVTAAVAAGAGSIDVSYDVPRVSAALDFINIMSYDLHGSWEKYVGHHTDMNPNRPYPSQHSIYNTVNHWMKRGASADKLVLGMASYGRTWKLKEPCNDWALGGKGAWTGGLPGKYTGETGFLAYYEICQKDWKQKMCTKDSDAMAPYGTDGRDFIGYDDEESIVYKVNKIVKAKDLGGVMFWALDLDDFHGNCGNKKYPLINAAKNALMGLHQTFPKCKTITNDKCVPVTTKAPVTTKPGNNGCRRNEIGPWRGKPGIDAWCKHPGNCPNKRTCGESYAGCTTCMCTCDDPTTTKTTIATTKSTTKSKPTTITIKPTIKSTTKTATTTTTTMKPTTTTMKPITATTTMKTTRTEMSTTTTTTKMPTTKVVKTTKMTTKIKPGMRNNCYVRREYRAWRMFHDLCKNNCHQCDINQSVRQKCHCPWLDKKPKTTISTTKIIARKSTTTTTTQMPTTSTTTTQMPTTSTSTTFQTPKTTRMPKTTKRATGCIPRDAYRSYAGYYRYCNKYCGYCERSRSIRRYCNCKGSGKVTRAPKNTTTATTATTTKKNTTKSKVRPSNSCLPKYGRTEYMIKYCSKYCGKCHKSYVIRYYCHCS